MVLLQLAEDGVKYIKQNMCDKKTGMTQPFSAWNVQYEIRKKHHSLCQFENWVSNKTHESYL